MPYLMFKILLYIKIFLLINIKCFLCFNVNFHYNYDLKVDDTLNTEIRERELQKLYTEKGFHNFNGFESVLSLPLVHPIDICILKTERGKYAAALHAGPRDIRHFVIFKINNESFEQLSNIPKPHALSLDCKAFNDKGYIALVLNATDTIRFPERSSSIYQINSEDIIKPIQYFTIPNIKRIYLWSSSRNFFMLQIINQKNKTLHNISCPYYLWSGEKFTKLGTIACSEFEEVNGFEINGEYFMTIAYSQRSPDIFIYSEENNQFILYQRLKEISDTKDIQYFNLKTEKIGTVQHYLLTLNGKKNHNQTINKMESLTSELIFYLYDNSNFKPILKFSMKGIKKIFPLEHKNSAKKLFIAITTHQIRVFTFEKNELFENPIDYFAEAFGYGLSNVRTFHDNDNSYLVVANSQLRGNNSHVFQLMFKEDLRTNTLRHQIVNWVESETKRLEKIDINELNKKIEQKLHNLDKYGFQTDLENSNINSVKTENLIYPKLKMSKNYWKALFYINQAVELLDQQLKQKDQLRKQQQQQERSKRNTIENLEWDNILEVDTLIVNHELKAKSVNEINLENLEFKEIKTPRLTIKKEINKKLKNNERFYNMENPNSFMDVENIEVPHLQIQGKLNEYNWEDLLNNTLKRNAEIQFFKSPIKINNLNGVQLVVTNNEINGNHLSSLIPIDGGEFVVNQDIEFAAPIQMRDLYIHERLNNIHVFEGKLDVLLKRSNTTQIIEGPKDVMNVKVMEPITIAGQLLGKHLKSITPNKAVHDPLVLQGDYVINGDVAINEILKASDIIDLRSKISVKQTLDNGIAMDDQIRDVNLKFIYPLKTNNSHVSFVNGDDIQRLIKLNSDDIQIVEGLKTFENSLEIQRGFSEVKNLNGIDIENLEKNSFLKHTNQTIRVPMEFKKIQAKSIIAENIRLNNLDMNDYLRKTGNQSVQANLVINNFKTNSLRVEKLNTNHRIFQQNLHNIYQQKSRNAPQEDVLLNQRKFHGSIYVQNLILNSSINNRNVLDIENNLLQLEGNIKYVGDFKFNYPLNIKHLKFHGNINGIKAKDFGNCWLQKKGQGLQEFYGAQSVAIVNSKNVLHCYGKINNYTIEDFVTKTYWTNRDEHIDEIEFANPIEMSSGLNTSTFNSKFFPHDILHHSNSQHFLQPLIIEGDLEVEGHITNVSLLNHINLYALEDFLYGNHGDTLFVENAYFSQGLPLYKTLNHHRIPHILDSVWLANENIVLHQNINMENAYFESLLLYEGPINNMDLEFIKDSYFSKSNNQNISVDMVFDDNITYTNEISAGYVELLGPIKDNKSCHSFNFLQFVDNTLKTSGPHTISGNWSILEAIVDNGLNQILINDLNLVTDVVHKIIGEQPFNINSPKTFSNVLIENVYATSFSRLNCIPISNWIDDAVYLYENYTIQGSTTIQSVNVYNDLRTLGKLNNLKFNENSLLLQDRNQTLNGNLRIISHMAEEKQFRTNNIDNMFADYINSEYIPNFMDNILSLSKDAAKIEGHIVFKEPLKVDKFQGPKELLMPTTHMQLMKRSEGNGNLTGNNIKNVENHVRNSTKIT